MDIVSVLFAHQRLRAVDYEEFSITGAVTTLTATRVTVAHLVLIRFESGPVRYRVDGGAPTASVGWPLYDGDQLLLSKEDATNFQAIRTGATNGTGRAIYYRRGFG